MVSALLAASLLATDVAPPPNTLRRFALATDVRLRFASTAVSLDFDNQEDCTRVETLTIQKPLEARLSSLVIATDDCVTTGDVQATADAVDAFESAVAGGREGAIIHAYDLGSFLLQVSISPRSRLNVSLGYEESLELSAGSVSLVLPLSSGLRAERVEATLTVDEPLGGVESLRCAPSEAAAARRLQDAAGAALAPAESVQVSTALSPSMARATVAVESGLAARVECAYEPAALPEDGLLLIEPAPSDGSAAAFMYVLNPPSVAAAPMARDVQLVADVSGSMAGQKLEDAKSALREIVGMLTPADRFSMLAFSSNLETATGFAWRHADGGAVASAHAWIDGLAAAGGTNLDEATRLGLAALAAQQQQAAPQEARVPIFLLLTDGEASTGVTDHAQIRANARAANAGGAASVWAFALGAGADYNLLLGLSVDNGGSAFVVYEGYGSTAAQISAAATAALGSVLLSSVTAELTGVGGLGRLTPTTFPLLAAGSELVVMGECSSCTTLDVRTTATSAVGAVSFAARGETGANASVLQGGALRRRLKHAQLAGVMRSHALLRATRDEDGAAAARAEALALALAPPQLVWPALTTMVATRADSCAADAPAGGGGPARCDGAGGAGGDVLDTSDGVPQAVATAALVVAHPLTRSGSSSSWLWAALHAPERPPR